MEVWLNIGYLSHILAVWVIISLILGAVIFSTFLGGYPSVKDML